MTKPRCPFCKRKLEIRKEHEDGGWSAYCTHCTMDAGHFSSKRELKDTFAQRPKEPLGCPLCGGEPKMWHSVWDGVRYYTIRCQDCSMDVGGIKGKRKAVRAWNTRRR